MRITESVSDRRSLSEETEHFFFAIRSGRVVINFTHENIYALSGSQNKGTRETFRWLMSLYTTLLKLHCRAKIMLISQWTETE